MSFKSHHVKLLAVANDFWIATPPGFPSFICSVLHMPIQLYVYDLLRKENGKVNCHVLIHHSHLQSSMNCDPSIINRKHKVLEETTKVNLSARKLEVGKISSNCI